MCFRNRVKHVETNDASSDESNKDETESNAINYFQLYNIDNHEKRKKEDKIFLNLKTNGRQIKF